MTSTLDIQRRLTSLGYDPGPVDGETGPKTRDAIKQFQRARGLAADGVAGPKTLAALFPEPSSPSAPLDAVTSQPKTGRAINEVIIHCSATPEGRDVSVATIRGWHKAQGWKDIGYHYVVMLDGSVEQGRPEAQIGSHVAGHNTGTLGVVYVGGVAKDGKTPKDTRTPAQKAALMATVKALIAKYTTIKKVTGHNQYAAKACPSFDVRKDPLGHIV